jgi:hypothetical protein
MATQSPLIRGTNGPHAGCHHPLSNPHFTAAIEARIQDAEMEKRVHGHLTDEASIMAKDGGSTISPAHDSGAKSMIRERELELETERCPQLECHWALSQGQQPSGACKHSEEGCPYDRRAKMVEQCETDKHAQGLLQDESSIEAVDAAKMREGKKATLVRQAEKEKHAHGHLQQERAIVEAGIPTTSSC